MSQGSPAHRHPAPRSWTIGEFHLDEAERRLTHHGMPISLTPKGFDLLVALAERGGGLVRKHELMRRLWPDTIVGEGTLARHISSLRQALEQGPSRRPLIQTVHKSGYRLLEPSRPVSPSRTDFRSLSYHRGRYFWGRRTEEDLKKALSDFDEVVRREPSCAAAHAARADCLTLLAGYGVPPSALREARQGAERALALDPSSADAHVVLGLIAQKCDRDWQEAEARYGSALQLHPQHTTALQRRGELLALLGRFDDGLALLTQASQADPTSLIIGCDLGKALFFARRYDAAIRECRTLLEMDPTFPRARLYLGLSLLLNGEREAALATMAGLGPCDSSAYAQAIVAYASAVAGRPQVAREALWALQHLRRLEYVTPYAFALVHLGLNEHEAALNCLERMVDDGHDVLGLSVSPLMDALRGTRRFQALLARARLGADDSQVCLPDMPAPSPLDALLAGLEALPAELRSAAEQLGEGAWRQPPAQGGFSLVEQAWHLADLEGEGYGLRIQRTLREDSPFLPNFDGDRIAAERDYRSRSLEEGLRAFAAARAANLALLRHQPPEAWHRPAVQEGVGRITLADIPRMMLEHDASHRAEIAALLAGAPPSTQSACA
jgi:DNA-binding winged helix-turn-helix (wHTH) protein/Tfp pilus assembly protein PilF